MEPINEIQRSRWWYRDIIRAFQSNRTNIRKMGLGSVVKAPIMGRMHCFYYDPKLKDELPYYDIFPLIVPIDYSIQGGPGFLGLNLHYLPPAARKAFFDKLLKVRSDKTLNPQSSLLISYSICKHVASLAPYKQCIKKYLYDHIRSPFLDINPEQWNMVVPLPLQSFKKGKPW